MHLLIHKIGFWKYQLIKLVELVLNRIDANYEFKKWMSLQIPENEFDHSLARQPFADHLSSKNLAVYNKELLRRRKTAHDRQL